MSRVEDRVQTVVEALRDALAEAYARDFGEDSPQELCSGASDADLQKVADLLGGAVPPSYAAFLRLHNGWRKYSGNAMLLAAGEQSASWVTERIANLRAILEDDDEEEVIEDVVFVMLGPDEPNFVVMKTNERSEDGELPVIHWDLEEGEFGAYDSFLEFLEDELEEALDDEDEDEDDDE